MKSRWKKGEEIIYYKNVYNKFLGNSWKFLEIPETKT